MKNAEVIPIEVIPKGEPGMSSKSGSYRARLTESDDLSGKLLRLGSVVSLLILGMFLGLPGTVKATTRTYSGTGMWTTAANWGGTVPQNGEDAVVPAGCYVTLETNTNSLLSLTVNGTLTVGNDGTARTITVTGNVSVASGATIAPGTTNANHTMIIGGHLTNSGTFDCAPTGSRTIAVTFNGSANQTVSGTGGTGRFNTITLSNTGAASNNILEISSANFSAAAGFLTLTQGIFKVSGSFSFTNTFFSTAAYAINASSGIWINNSNVTVSGQNGDPTISGLLRLTQGTYVVGTAADNDLKYATGSTIDIQGGALNVTGALQGTTVVPLSGSTNTVTYSQSGGTVTVATVNVASDASSGGKSYGSFDIKAAGSSFTMSGGTIVLQNPTNVQNDLVVAATLGSVTGGTFQFGNTSTTITNPYAITTSTPIFNLTVKGTVSAFTELLNSPITIKGTFVIESGATFLALGQSMGVAGDWTNNGTFTPGTQTTTLNGTAAQNISGSAATGFSSLTLNNSAGLTLNSNASVSGALTLTLGDIATGSKVLTQSGTSAGNGDVVGTVSRSDVGGTTRSFGNPNVQIRNSGGTLTTLTVNLVKASPSGFGNSVRRTYTLTGSGTTPSAVVRLHYLDAELNGNSEASLELWRQDTGTWNSQSFTTGDTTNNWVEKTGVTGFSPWTISGPTGPTAIEMVGYAARAGRDGKVLVQWETGREVNNLGFNVYREEDGKRFQINKSLIVGSGLMASPGTVMTAGRSYAWQSVAAQSENTVYWIEEIDLSGYTVWHGPIISKASDGKISARERAIADQTVTLSDMAAESTFNGVTRPVESLASTAKANTMKLTGAGINPSSSAFKIALKQEGWYRVTQPQLVAAGFNPSFDPNALQLFADGGEIPISVITNNGSFDSSSAIEFYGQGIDTTSTDTHVYSLVVGSNGLRIQNVQGQGGLPPSNSFLYTVERKDRSIYLTGVHNGDAENFFGTPVGAASVDQAIALKNVDTSAPGQATIEVGMQGFTSVPHVVTVSLNAYPLGKIEYSNQAQGVSQFQVPNSLLAEGQNIVTLAGQAGGQDVSLVDHIRVSYWHSYAADGNALKFSATANQEVTLTGFTSTDVKVLDLTNPLSPSQVAATVTSQKTSNALVVTVAVPGTGTRTLLAIGGDQTRSALAVTADKASTWRTPGNAADLVIITHSSLKDSYAQLQELRRSQGLKVALVDVEDLYDEFNSGNKSPQAIKDFLAYARSSWRTAPKYVLLAGSASYDPKNYNGFGDYDLVPTKLIDTLITETASDDWFADFNNDGLAEMAVGRLPTRTPVEAGTTVTKLAVYDKSDALNSALLVADSNLNFDFEAASKSLAALFPGSISVQQIDRGQIGTATAKQRLLDGIAAGQKIVNYAGHGSPSIWRDNLLTAADALGLTNTGRYPVFVAMTCLNGEFQHPQLNPLASALMNSREGGAIAVWASSGMTSPSGQATMNQQFYTTLFQSGQPVKGKASQAALTLGEITNNAKSAVGDADIRRTWILFGDPSMTVR